MGFPEEKKQRSWSSWLPLVALPALLVTSLTRGERRRRRRQQNRAQDGTHAQHWGVGKACQGGQAPTSSVSSRLTKTHCFVVSVSDCRGELGFGVCRHSNRAVCTGRGRGLAWSCHLWPRPHTGTQHRRNLPGDEKTSGSWPQHPRASLCEQWTFCLATRQPLEAGHGGQRSIRPPGDLSYNN